MSLYYLVTTFDKNLYPKFIFILTKYFAKAITKGFKH